MGSGSKASFTPFVDPRVYQTSPTEEDEDASGKINISYMLFKCIIIKIFSYEFGGY